MTFPRLFQPPAGSFFLPAFRLPAWEGRLRAKEKKHPKLYWIDSGVARAARRRFGDVTEEEAGTLFEGWLAALPHSYRQYRGLFDDWHWWSPSGSTSLEVDFLLWRDDRCVAIEAKASRRFRSEHTKGLDAFADGYRGGSAPRRIVVYLGNQRLRTAEGIDVLPVREFLDEIERDRLFA